ncbi:MAG: VWA domain-containing protein, partial [Candidatus Omnitrophica bacterium]|nr:VWA domain-containing protein [Candidatus Omnitrophota bacterium]
RHSVMALRLIALALLIVAAARPQSRETILENNYTEGVDILLALDCSGSMSAMDLDFKKRTRLDVAKEVTEDFIKKRNSDRIGLVVFAGDAYTQCPMTLDYGVLLEILKSVSIGMDGTIPDGTAIGLATARCLKRLENSQTKSKVVILLTDGENNAGSIDPLQAAIFNNTQTAEIYTIGTGSTSGEAPYLVQSPLVGEFFQNQPVRIDEETLEKMATMTGGEYFRASDQQQLRNIFNEIDQLEKTKIEDLGEHRYIEHFPLFTMMAMGMILLEVFLSQTRFRILP